MILNHTGRITQSPMKADISVQRVQTWAVPENEMAATAPTYATAPGMAVVSYVG